MKERRQYERFAAKLPARLEAITPGRKNVLYLATKDISAAGHLFIQRSPFRKEHSLFWTSLSRMTVLMNWRT
jgi:hypothetical protein